MKPDTPTKFLLLHVPMLSQHEYYIAAINDAILYLAFESKAKDSNTNYCYRIRESQLLFPSKLLFFVIIFCSKL
jgi:hypothetical protein